MKINDDTSGSAVSVYQVLDVRGYNCPLPILKTKIALRGVPTGSVLRVLATDPMAVVDFRAYSAKTGPELLRWSEGDELEFDIRKADDGAAPPLAVPG